MFISAQLPIVTCWELWPQQEVEPMNSLTQKPNTTGQKRWVHRIYFITLSNWIHWPLSKRVILNIGFNTLFILNLHVHLWSFLLQVASQVKRLTAPGARSVSVKWQQFNTRAPPPVQAPKQLHALFNDCHALVYGFVPHCTQVLCNTKAVLNCIYAPFYNYVLLLIQI